MSIEARKIELIQAFLNVQSEEVISAFEKLLESSKSGSADQEIMGYPEELDRRIDQSEHDFDNGRFKTTAALRSKF